ncbi:hypothetical protein [Rosenbergiella epipactidis]|uniref:hypothetical protein n=1 Tax=Rosenbergiella epipactidis TaxID=1544694 RepID=UPI001F4EDB74|nr:hypothetical protein [Rosenbergiella epipactidis]
MGKKTGKETGGPAFPREDYQANGYARGFEGIGQEGMSLRDYFAAKAMQGDWAAQDDRQGYFDNDVSDDVLVGRARVHYRMADAMIKARGE